MASHQSLVVPTGRVFVALDLEDLVAPARREGHLREAITAVTAAVQRLGASGLLLGGVAVCDRDLQVRSAWALDDLRIRVHTPENWVPNASDLLLLDHLRSAVPGSADTVVIGSGDHIFSSAAAALVALGKRVLVPGRPGSVSPDLRVAASTFVPLTMNERIRVAA